MGYQTGTTRGEGMAKYRITYLGQAAKKEEVEADDFTDEGEWTTFRKFGGHYPKGVAQVLRVRTKDISRIDRVSD